MRQVRNGVAMSLDGCITEPNGEADWIVMDLGIDFGEIIMVIASFSVPLNNARATPLRSSR